MRLCNIIYTAQLPNIFTHTYRWRHFIPLLPEDAPIFCADLPGYGASAAIEKHDKLTVGTAVLNALKTEVKRTSSNPPSGDIPIVLIGHDRGARVTHRLTVSGIAGFDIRGVCLIDIVRPYHPPDMPFSPLTPSGPNKHTMAALQHAAQSRKRCLRLLPLAIPRQCGPRNAHDRRLRARSVPGGNDDCVVWQERRWPEVLHR